MLDPGQAGELVSGLFRHCCRQVIETSNLLVLHNSNPDLTDKNIKDLSERNYAEKSVLAPYQPELYDELLKQIKETEDRIKKDRKSEVQVDELVLEDPAKANFTGTWALD